MKQIRFTIILLLMLYVPAGITAQTDSSVKNKEGAFKLGAFYNSGLNYYGRTDSLHSSGFFPLAELWLDKHFYINAAPVFVNNAVSQFEYTGTVLTGGFTFRDAKWAGNIYAVKPLYKDNSELVQSALKVQAATTFTRLTKILNITAGADIKYSDKIDYGLTAGADHLFRFEAGDQLVFVINPSAVLNAGTQQFTGTSYKRSGFLLFPGIQQQVTEEVQKFNILSYEFSMPIIAAKNKFMLILNPAYVIPQNLIQVAGRPDLSERGKEMFYITAGAKLSF